MLSYTDCFSLLLLCFIIAETVLIYVNIVSLETDPASVYLLTILTSYYTSSQPSSQQHPITPTIPPRPDLDTQSHRPLPFPNTPDNLPNQLLALFEIRPRKRNNIIHLFRRVHEVPRGHEIGLLRINGRDGRVGDQREVNDGKTCCWGVEWVVVLFVFV